MTAEQRKKERRRVGRIIAGALKCTIDAHGPIDRNLIGSASKRAAAQLVAAEEAKQS